jgi:hypothetical protein
MSTKLKNILSEIKWEGRDIEIGKVYTAKTMSPFKTPIQIKEETEETDADSEMAVSQLSRSVDYAKMLIDKLKDKGDLEPWVQAKITKAEDYLNAVYGYYKGKDDSSDLE